MITEVDGDWQTAAMLSLFRNEQETNYDNRVYVDEKGQSWFRMSTSLIQKKLCGMSPKQIATRIKWLSERGFIETTENWLDKFDKTRVIRAVSQAQSNEPKGILECSKGNTRMGENAHSYIGIRTTFKNNSSNTTLSSNTVESCITTNNVGFEKNLTNPQVSDELPPKKEKPNATSDKTIIAEFAKTFLEFLNQSTNKSYRIVTEKAKRQLLSLSKNGFTEDEIKTAITNASQDSFHRENGYKYLTLEFVTRQDQFEKWLNLKKATNTPHNQFPTPEEYRKTRISL